MEYWVGKSTLLDVGVRGEFLQPSLLHESYMQAVLYRKAQCLDSEEDITASFGNNFIIKIFRAIITIPEYASRKSVTSRGHILWRWHQTESKGK